MEEDGEETPRTPFWIQSTTNVRRAELYRRRASSLFFNSGVLIILLLLFALLSMVFVIPSVISFTSQIFRPNLVKRSWDSINLVLVLVALAFGFLSRNINNDEKSRFDDRSRSDLSTGALVASPSSSTPHQWYDFPEQPISGLRRHRSTSSYPDLRELAPPWNHRVEAPWRFSDDTHLNTHRVLNYDRYYFRREQDSDTKEVVHVDTVVDLPKEDSYAPRQQPPIPEEESYSQSPQPPAPEDESYSRPSQPPAPAGDSFSPPPQLPSPQSLQPQPPAPRPSAKKKPIRTYHNVAADRETSSRSEVNEVLLPETELPAFHDSERKGQTSRKRGKGERRRARSSEPRKLESSIDDPASESPSPPRILPEFQESEQNTGGVERKRTSGNATKRFFTSFYQKKKKRQRQRSMDNLDNLLRHPQPPVKFQLPPPSPPPPPPPPPSSVLNNLFTSKKERRKKVPPTTPPPPPPPPPRTAARAPKPTITRVSPFITEKPRAPVKMSFFNGIDDSSSGGESPMNRIPPPPPMPPLKMPDWKFAVEGDYVRVQSALSSGSVSPDGDEAHSPSSAVASPLFCPSPDVDTKADTFIARFRAGLKLEKINSFNQNQGLRMSNLGPGPSSSNH